MRCTETVREGMTATMYFQSEGSGFETRLPLLENTELTCFVSYELNSILSWICLVWKVVFPRVFRFLILYGSISCSPVQIPHGLVWERTMGHRIDGLVAEAEHRGVYRRLGMNWRVTRYPRPKQKYRK